MHTIQVHNTLTAKVEPFVPQKEGEVRMYTCGPTVYNYAHIGNFRTFVFQDILRRFLKLRGFKLNHVMNLTDVDDRIIANAAAAGVSIRDYTEKYMQAFFADCKTLSLERPEHWIRATDHIQDMVALIQKLQREELHLRQRRLHLLPHRQIQGLRQTLQDRSLWNPGGRARRVDDATKKRARAISLSGKRPSPANQSGRRRLARAVPAGTSNAPPWP